MAKSGRPESKDGALKAYPIRIEDDIIKELDNIAETESEKTGYKLTRSHMIRKALLDFIKRYKSEHHSD